MSFFLSNVVLTPTFYSVFSLPSPFYPFSEWLKSSLETLALLAEGNRISSLSRVKGHKEETILNWLREAAHHAEQIEEVLMAKFRIQRGQLDALWTYVKNKGEKKTIGKRKAVANSGVRR